MAQILSGTRISKGILSEIRQDILEIREKGHNFRPKLVIIQVGEREDSNVYIRAKCKAAHSVGVETEHIKFPRTVSENELLRRVDRLNTDSTVHGIIVQLPLDCTNPINACDVTNAVSPLKDVDGIHIENAGRLANGELENFFIPCTPRGCLELILNTGIDLCGKHAVVIGRSKIVGAPMSALLLSCNATVTVCHSNTQRIDEICRQADVIVVACGCAKLVKRDWVRPGAVVIDCGINAIKDPTHPKGQRLVGDVDYENVKEVASWITPVPGGVGPMTVAMLIKNTVASAKRELLGALRNDLPI